MKKLKLFNIIIDYQVKSFKKLFYYCTCISSTIFKKIISFIKRNKSLVILKYIKNYKKD